VDAWMPGEEVSPAPDGKWIPFPRTCDWAERLSCHNADSRSKIIKWFKNSYWMSYRKWRVVSRSSSKALESPTLLFNVYRVLCREKSGRNMKLTTHLYLEPRLRVSGAIPSLPLYVFMTWPQKTLSICLFKLIHFYSFLFIYLFLLYLVIHHHQLQRLTRSTAVNLNTICEKWIGMEGQQRPWSNFKYKSPPLKFALNNWRKS
jgi:hypothetical protein